MLKARRVRTQFFFDRSHWRLDDGRTVLVKMWHNADKDMNRKMRRCIAVEEVCLEALAGLAVPRPAKIPARVFSRSLEAPFQHTAKVMAGERPLDEAGFDDWQSLGAWAFVVEQLVAFRRHGILFTDVSCATIMGAKNPLRVLFVDFQIAVPLIPGRKHFENHGYTPGASAPEIARGGRPTERGAVFVAAALLVRLLTGHDTTELRGPDGGLARSRRKLARMGATGVARLLASALSDDPRGRPADYEALLAGIAAAGLPARARKSWTALRAPYADYLAGGGM